MKPPDSLLKRATVGKLASAVPLLLALALLCFGPRPCFKNAPSKPHTVEAYGKLPLAFEPNEGQAAGEADFIAQGPGYGLGLRASEAVLALRSPQGARPLTLRLTGANAGAKARAEDPLPGRSNYYIGNDPSRWRTNIPNYRKVRYRQAWHGIDIVYYGNQGQLEFDFVVSPGADPRQIRLSLSGAEEMQVGPAGDVVVGAAGQKLRFRKPLVYQQEGNERREIAGRYAVHDGEISVDLGNYDPARLLVIDPALVYSTYLGSYWDFAQAITVDPSGNAYITGSGGPSGSVFVFVSKVNAAGSALLYSTHLGGESGGKVIAVDTSGNAYITGWTMGGMPTLRPIQSQLRGVEDAFVTKLDSAGSLVYCTYLGGSGADFGYGIAVDLAGNAYVTGSTGSSDFPTVNALQPAYRRGYQTGFVTKLNAAGSALVYSTYLGGSGNDLSYAIAIDPAGNAYVTGFTQSLDFPMVNALQPRIGDANPASQKGGDGFVAKLNPSGSGLVYSTYLGGSAYDVASGIAVDSAGNAYVTGYTSSSDFPVVNPLQSSYGGADANGTAIGDAFVAKLNASGSALLYSSYVGGGGDEEARSIAVDSAGNAYITGYTTSSDFPITNPLQAAISGSADAFVTKVGTGGWLVYSTYLGGAGSDSAYGIAVDSGGSTYITGWTMSTDFPTVNPLQAAPSTTGYSFVTKIAAFSLADSAVNLSATSLAFASQRVGTTSLAQTVTLWNSGTTAVLNIATVAISGANSSDFLLAHTCGSSLAVGAGCAIRVTFTPTATGTRTASVTIADDAVNSPQTISLAGFAPVVFLSASSLNFGSQVVGTSSPAQSVTIANDGVDALAVRSIAITGTNSADFGIVFNNCGTGLASRANCTIGIAFTPTAGGARAASLTIVDSASASSRTVTLTGTGLAPVVTLSVDSLAFGNQAVGATSSAQNVTVRNTGTASLIIADVSITGTNAADFSLNSAATTCRSAASVATSGNCVVSVFFKPSDLGARSASLAMTDNASGSPHRVSLSGSGLTPLPAVTLSATTLIFGVQAVGTKSAAQTVTLKNSGTAALRIAGIAISGANSADFAQTSNCGTGVAAAASCAITVSFTPAASGARTASLSVTDDAANSPQTLNLTGSGVLPTVASGGVVNGASFAPNQPLTAGSIASLFGTDLASSTAYASTTPLPKTLGGASVTVSSSAGSFQAPLFLVSPFQVNVQLPWELLGHSQATLTVTFSGASSNSITLAMTATSPGIFSLNSQGSGPGAILISDSADLAQAAGSVPGRTARPAKRGEYISIYCTGLGAVSNQPGSGAAAGASSTTTAAPSVTIGGMPAGVSFSGLAPGFAGLYQVNAQVPDNAPAGSAIPVVLIISGATSNIVTIAIQ